MCFSKVERMFKLFVKSFLLINEWFEHENFIPSTYSFIKEERLF